MSEGDWEGLGRKLREEEGEGKRYDLVFGSNFLHMVPLYVLPPPLRLPSLLTSCPSLAQPRRTATHLPPPPRPLTAHTLRKSPHLRTLQVRHGLLLPLRRVRASLLLSSLSPSNTFSKLTRSCCAVQRGDRSPPLPLPTRPTLYRRPCKDRKRGRVEIEREDWGCEGELGVGFRAGEGGEVAV